MSGYRIFIVAFAFISVATSLWAIWIVWKSQLRYKVAWTLGALFGFVGFGLNWTQPDDLFFLLGVAVPPVMVSELLAAKVVLVKVQFPS